MSCLLHLPFRLLPILSLPHAFPFYSNLKEMISHIALLLYMKAVTNMTRQMGSGTVHLDARKYDFSPNVLRAQWAVGGLSARQKGSAAERGESQAS